MISSFQSGKTCTLLHAVCRDMLRTDQHLPNNLKAAKRSHHHALRHDSKALCGTQLSWAHRRPHCCHQGTALQQLAHPGARLRHRPACRLLRTATGLVRPPWQLRQRCQLAGAACRSTQAALEPRKMQGTAGQDKDFSLCSPVLMQQTSTDQPAGKLSQYTLQHMPPE